jgi:hypothetical protein
VNIDALLSRFDGVQKMGENWRARCPACGGKSRKVSIRVVDDGKILLHCFDCSDIEAILQVIGLQASDLFPESLRPSDPIERKKLAQHMRQQADIAAWGAALEVLDFESRIVLIAAGDVINGKPINLPDMERLRLAEQRIADARRHLRPIDTRQMMKDLAWQRHPDPPKPKGEIVPFRGDAA